MNTQQQIDSYIADQPEPKRSEMRELNRVMLGLKPGPRRWFFDGKNEQGKTVANPSIGYGLRTLTYADGSTREFYRIGISANKTGISVYVLGLHDNKYLAKTYGKKIGKADVTGYCIRFKTLEGIDRDVLTDVLRYGMEAD